MLPGEERICADVFEPHCLHFFDGLRLGHFMKLLEENWQDLAPKVKGKMMNSVLKRWNERTK
jgi:hypothetical protein|tara:strand:- start:7324 stop:7509 length:186 start_codon:yes stop_codon:yes gene_type:complete